MIRLAQDSDFSSVVGSEARIRINAAYEAYGLQTSFLQFYIGDDGSQLALMDGNAVLSTPATLNEEWLQFLSVHPDICTVRTDAKTGQKLAEQWGVPVKSGAFMTYDGGAVTTDIATELPPYEALYQFLADYFALPPFDAWYVDVSHRVRHGQCHIASIMRDGAVACNVMTVAETAEDVLLGAVATAPSYRRQGYATGCIYALMQQVLDKRIHISPVDERAERLYQSLGFSVTGSWAQLLHP